MVRSRFILQIAVIVFFVSGLMTAQVAAFKESTKDPGPAGQWRGDSTCTIKDSPCHDEIVVYEIAAVSGQSNEFTLKASKIVNGQRELMNLLDCIYGSANHVLSCKAHEKPNGTWSFQISGKNMQGTLVLDDKRMYRRISVIRTKG